MTTAPHRVTLGRSGLRVSPICFGTWQLSPRFWGDQPEDELINAMKRAFDIGINFYDTADAYGDGLAERVLGKAIKDMPRDQIVIATKVFHHFFPDGHRFGDLTPEYIRQACDNSLSRMKLDYIDLYQCHSFDALVDPADLAGVLNDLVKQGKIRAYGTSNWTVEQMRMGDAFGNFTTCQPRYSLIARALENDVLPYCRTQNTGVLVFSPLHKGLLTGKYTGTETFTDLRSNQADFKGERFQMICDRLKEVGKVAKKYNLTTVQLVLAVTLMNPAITCAIAGIKNARHIEDAAGAMGKRISHEDAFNVRQWLTV